MIRMELTEQRWNKQAKEERGMNRVMHRGWSQDLQNEFHLIEVEKLKEYVDWDSKHVIDIGCGIGRLTRVFAQFGSATVLGVDFSEEMLEVADSRTEYYTNTNFLKLDIKSDWKCLRSHIYDVAYCGSVLIHILDDSVVERVYGHIMAILDKPCGKAILINEIADVRKEGGGYCVVRTREFYNQCAKKAGFDIVNEDIFTFEENTYHAQVLSVSGVD